MHLLSYLGGTVSMVAATFIIFSALSMGVTERQRTLAMLRAIGMERSRVGWLVVIEGLLAALGVLVGVPLGLLWVRILVALPAAKDMLTTAWRSAWAASRSARSARCSRRWRRASLPAWSAMRAKPLEAMAPLATSGAGAAVRWRCSADPHRDRSDPHVRAARRTVPLAEIVPRCPFLRAFRLGLPG
jgi:putative ABC transport system permease protein